MNKKDKIFLIVGVVIFVGVVLAILFGLGFFQSAPKKTLDLPERNDTVPQVPIMFDYGTKIVYTTNTTVSKDAYIDDCETRGGVFNVCGSTCAPTAQTCTAVCALTCTEKTVK